ncbi:MAG: hypothetical protein ABSG89_02555 [Bacteroidales bacterium]
MKKLTVNSLALFLGILFISFGLTDCKKSNPIKYPNGTFPDTVSALTDINSQYDDINTDLYTLNGSKVLIFSSNRNSSGGQFDLVQASLSYTWDQTNGKFTLSAGLTSDPFLTKLLATANTSGNDFGPYSLYSSTDGYEYLILSSQNGNGDLDFYYLKNWPVNGNTLPNILGPYPITWLNTSSDDAYLSFNLMQDTVYFSSAAGGNFDIYMKPVSSDTSLSDYFNRSYSASAKVDSVNSDGNDKCPYICGKIMVFASDRGGGMGGFDLYYSVFRNGAWSSPINFGPSINTQYNEYRPVLVSDASFTNYLMIFSSDRPGGKGGYDLYFTGITIPQ